MRERYKAQAKRETELVRLWQSGDDEAGNELAKSVEPLLREIVAQKVGIWGGDEAEALSTLRLGVVQAMNSYKPCRASWRGYLACLLRRRSLSRLRYNSAGNRRGTTLSFSEEVGEEEGLTLEDVVAGVDLSQAVDYSDNEFERLREAIRALKPSYRRIAELYLAGLNPAAIGRTIGRSRQNVDVKLGRIKRRLRTLLQS